MRIARFQWSEFYHIINDLGLEMAEEEIGEWMAHADVDKGGSVKWEEFEPMVKRAPSERDCIARAPEASVQD